jgi:adenosylcobinamide-GDP ribazoletransferase
MSLAPLVALVLAAICGLPLLITRDRPAIALLIAIVSFALLAWATRALHLDGLADTADALGSGKPAAAALEIARKSDIGPFGVITLIFTLLLQIAAVASLPDAHDAYFAFVIAIVTSRVALTWACTRMWPAARPDGLGAVVAATVPLLVAIAWTIITIALAWIFVGIAGGVSVVLGILADIVLLVIARRRLGGMTGDVLGATIEMTATTAVLVLALIA